MNDDVRLALGLSASAIVIILSIAALIIIAKSWPSTESDFIEFQPSGLPVSKLSIPESPLADNDQHWDLSPGAMIKIQAAVEFSITNGSETIIMTGPLTLTVQ